MAPKSALKRPAAAAPAAAGGDDEEGEDNVGGSETVAPPPAKRRAGDEAVAAAPAAAAAPPGDVASAASATSAAPGGRPLKDVLAPVAAGLVVAGAAAGGAASAAGAAQAEQLRAAAEELMNRFDLWIGGQRHCIVELEAYVHSPAHPDPYTHSDEDQGRAGYWYFHKKGGTYKSGSFKGMDLSSGNAAAGVHCGLLIRSVRELEPPPAGSPAAKAGAAAAGKKGSAVTEGPCLVVDRILRLNGQPSIAAYVGGRAAEELPAEGTEGLRLLPSAAPRSDEVWTGPRVGLVLRREGEKKTHSEGSPSDFVARAYRFSTAPWQLSKFRGGFAAAAYLANRGSVKELGERFAIPKMAEYAEAADRGRKAGAAGVEAFVDRKIATQPELCELFGACLAKSLGAAATAAASA